MGAPEAPIRLTVGAPASGAWDCKRVGARARSSWRSRRCDVCVAVRGRRGPRGPGCLHRK
eukprot:3664106-Alexandrium_andersonii.AAC.1